VGFSLIMIILLGIERAQYARFLDGLNAMA
jgi:hypothetical protein